MQARRRDSASRSSEQPSFQIHIPSRELEEEGSLRDGSKDSRCLFSPSYTCGIQDSRLFLPSPTSSPQPLIPSGQGDLTRTSNSLAWAGTPGEAVFSENTIREHRYTM